MKEINKVKTWELEKARKQFKEILNSCAQEPQMICNKNEPVGVIIDVKYYIKLLNHWRRRNNPTIAELLDELAQIKLQEPIDIEIPSRQDRPNPILEN
jgi:prevent-host-death family protein